LATIAFTTERERSALGGFVSRFHTIMAAPNRSEGEKATMSVRLRIISAMQQIATEQQVTLPPLTDGLSLHETGFDSLGFAILVARLEDDLGIDPFTISEDAAFPLTVGDFVRAYENVPA
jgi:acyl carrier protein